MPRRISFQQILSKEDITMGRIDYYTNMDNSIPSITIAPQELRNIKSNSELSDLTLKEMMEDSSATGLVLKANKPWRDVYSKLHYEFLNIVQSHALETEIFQAIGSFICKCNDVLELMRGMKSKIEISDLSTEEISLENERNTWRLIYCLYQNRLDSADFHSQMEMDNNSNISEKEVIDVLYKNSRLIREYQLIIDWLEKNALDQADRLPPIENFTDKTVAWENTLHQLQNLKAGITFASTRPIISTMDPDAPVREGKPLHDLDKEDDARLEKRMLIEVRCGRLQKAQALAIHCGQQWRAACLLGWTPFHDPNYRNSLQDTKLPIEGNPNRSLWKLCAWELSNDVRVGQYYRAIYSSLCGNVNQLLTIANSWQDGLWAYMKTLLDIKVEAEVRGFKPKAYIALPDEYWKGENTLNDIFDELEASKNLVISAQANEPAHRIQKYLILDQITTLMDEIEMMLNKKTCDSQFLRFLAHLVLFLKQIGKSLNEKIADKVLLEYVKILIEIGDPVLIAFYTSTLPTESQITIYAQFLEKISNYEERKKCLNAAEDANLNVELITKLVVENIRQKNIELHQVISSDLTNADLEKIDALDWLTFYASQIEEALWQTNALIRYFLSNNKLDAAKKAFNKIPPHTIETIIREFLDFQNTIENMSTNILPKKRSFGIHEYLCYKSYLCAQEDFAEWFSLFHHDKPIPVEDLLTYSSFTEKVAHEHKYSQYNIELERWKTTMKHKTKAVKQLLFNVLLFPDGGWLVGSTNFINNESMSSEEILRDHQLEKLRKLCIPKVVLLLHNVMTDMNEYAECIQIADILASDQHQLYKVYSKNKLREIFKKICDTSLILMDQKKDPWGYSK